MIRTDNSKVIELLQSQLEERQWISVKDRLPFYNKWVIAIIYEDNQFYVPFSCQYVEGKFQNDDDERLGILDYTYKVTHWMPLPESPKQS
jgi:hypothetical protein